MTLTAWAASTPLLVEDGDVLDVCLMQDKGGRIRIGWCHDGGRRKEPDGPIAQSWAEASRAYAIIDQRRRALAP